MRKCVIYSPFFDIEQAFNIIKTVYKNWNIVINIITSTMPVKAINELETSNPEYIFSIITSATNSNNFTNKINGLYNFFNSVKTKNQTLHQKVLEQISVFNMVIDITISNDIPHLFYSELLKICESLNGFIFWGSTYLLDCNGNLLIDVHGNSEIQDFNIVSPTTCPDQNLIL